MEDLSPNRRRQIRKVPQSATPAERKTLLEDIHRKTAPTFDYFLLSLFGALLTGLALLLDQAVLAFAAAVVLPFASPLFTLALLPASARTKKGLIALLAFLINSGLIFGAGALSGWLGTWIGNTSQNERIFILSQHFAHINGLDLLILALSTIVCAMLLIRREKTPGTPGVLISYEMALPLAAAGFGLVTGNAQLWPAALLLAGVHTTLVILLGLLTFLVLGFPPAKLFGWLFAFLTAAAFILALIFTPLPGGRTLEQPSPIPPAATKTPTATFIESTATATSTRTPTPTTPPTETLTPTATRTATITPTPEPTSYWGIVNVQDGAVIREAPSFDAIVIAYANDGDLIEILDETLVGNQLWLKVRTGSGETGWMVRSLVITPTPTSE
jgi:hypothetical protein